MTSPVYGSTQTLAVTTTSAGLTLNALNKAALRLQIVNAGASLVFVKVWNATANGAGAATTADYPVVVSTNVPTILDMPQDADTIYAICASGTSTLYVTAVDGDF